MDDYDLERLADVAGSLMAMGDIANMALKGLGILTALGGVYLMVNGSGPLPAAAALVGGAILFAASRLLQLALEARAHLLLATAQIELNTR